MGQALASVFSRGPPTPCAAAPARWAVLPAPLLEHYLGWLDDARDLARAQTACVAWRTLGGTLRDTDNNDAASAASAAAARLNRLWKPHFSRDFYQSSRDDVIAVAKGEGPVEDEDDAKTASVDKTKPNVHWRATYMQRTRAAYLRSVNKPRRTHEHHLPSDASIENMRVCPTAPMALFRMRPHDMFAPGNVGQLYCMNLVTGQLCNLETSLFAHIPRSCSEFVWMGGNGWDATTCQFVVRFNGDGFVLVDMDLKATAEDKDNDLSKSMRILHSIRDRRGDAKYIDSMDAWKGVVLKRRANGSYRCISLTDGKMEQLDLQTQDDRIADVERHHPTWARFGPTTNAVMVRLDYTFSQSCSFWSWDRSKGDKQWIRSMAGMIIDCDLSEDRTRLVVLTRSSAILVVDTCSGDLVFSVLRGVAPSMARIIATGRRTCAVARSHGSTIGAPKWRDGDTHSLTTVRSAKAGTVVVEQHSQSAATFSWRYRVSLNRRAIVLPEESLDVLNVEDFG